MAVIITANGEIERLQHRIAKANVDAAGAVMESDFNANTMLYAQSDDTPTARLLFAASNTIIIRKPLASAPEDLVIGIDSIPGRDGTADIASLSMATLRSMLNQIATEKTADEIVNNSAAVQDDDDLKLTLPINKKYHITGLIIYSSHESADIRVTMTIPTGATMEIGTLGGQNLTVSDFRAWRFDTSGTEIFDFGAGVGTKVHHLIQGTVRMGSTSGDLLVRWAQWFAHASDTKFHADSYLRAIEY